MEEVNPPTHRISMNSIALQSNHRAPQKTIEINNLIYKKKSIKKGYLSQTANLFVNLKSNTMKNTLQRYGLSAYLQISGAERSIL